MKKLMLMPALFVAIAGLSACDQKPDVVVVPVAPSPVVIQGPAGEKGETGNQGNQGIQGDRGVQGGEGVQGMDGAQGEKGNQGNDGEVVQPSEQPSE